MIPAGAYNLPELNVMAGYVVRVQAATHVALLGARFKQ